MFFPPVYCVFYEWTMTGFDLLGYFWLYLVVCNRFLRRQIWSGKMLSKVFWQNVIFWSQSGTLLWWAGLDVLAFYSVFKILSFDNLWLQFHQVRFFYSFTCRENLYLVMEYLNGGDLYSLLRNLGCLDEDVTRVYIAEVVSVVLSEFFL